MTDAEGRRGRRGLWLVVAVIAAAALALLPFACEEEPAAAPPEPPEPAVEAQKPAAPRARDGAAKPAEETSKEHDGSHVFRVVDERQSPVAGARVWVRRPPGGVLRLPTAPPTLVTGKDGLFRLPPDSGVRVVDVAANGRIARRLRVPAGRREAAKAEDVVLAAGWWPVMWEMPDATRAEIADARPRGVLWPRGTRPAGGPSPDATDEELTALGAIVFASDAHDRVSFDGAYGDETIIDVIAAGRLAAPAGRRGARSGDTRADPLTARWTGVLHSALVARVSVTDLATGRLVEGAVVEDAANAASAGSRRAAALLGSRERESWRHASGLRDITDEWALTAGSRYGDPTFAGQPPVPVRTLAWFGERKSPAGPKTVAIRITAPGYDATAEKIVLVQPWAGRAVPVVQVKLAPSASTQPFPLTFVDGGGAPLAGVFVDAPLAPTGSSVEGPSRDRAPVRVRGFTDAHGRLTASIAVGTWTPWRGSDHLPTWEISDFGVRPGQAESARAMLAEALARVLVVDPDGNPVRYSLPLLVSHEPVDQALRRPGQDGRLDGQPEVFVASPEAPGTLLPLRAFHYGRRRFRPVGAFAETEAGTTVDAPFQGVATVRFTTLE